jgi:EpsG family
MFINDILLIWITLIFLFVGTSLEVFNQKKEIQRLLYFLGSVSLLIFSLNYLQECTDHFHYEIAYVKYKDSYNILNFLQPDSLFGNLASLWQSIFDLSATHVDQFLTFYQTLSLFILIICIYFICGRWNNTVLFMTLFGSLQFHHLTICSLRHGLSSSITIIILALIYKDRNIKALNKLSYLYKTLFAIVAINAHWTAIIIIPLIYSPVVIEIILKSYKDRIKLLLLTCLIIFILLLLTIIILQSQIEIYREQSIEYGARIHFTAINDILLLFITNRISRRENFCESELFMLRQLKMMSILLVVMKVVTFIGFGAGVRIVMGLHIIQLMCLPTVLNKLDIPSRITTLFMLSIPYLFFIFSSKVETFKFTNFNF